MLKMIIPMIMLLLTTWFSKNNMIWVNKTMHSLIISLIPLLFFKLVTISSTIQPLHFPIR